MADMLANGTATAASAAASAVSALASPQPSAPPASSSLSSSSSPAAATATAAAAERMQLIDDHQAFHPDLVRSLHKWSLHDVGFGYNLCAVLGSQSTGKSTLLNKLFGTSFDVMDESQRRQTTKGIWLCRAANMPVLVMDVEGTDGRERGEDQDFERKSALFSMASSECLIINLWEHQVGLYQGANMGLLKTVFEVNLGLFQAAKRKTNTASKDKTLLFFVIRDHVGATPLSNLEATLKADLARIWDSLVKPEGLESSVITDFFDLEFTALPHKLLQPQEFDRQVAALAGRFSDRTRRDFLFRAEYHKRIPADGLPMYLESVWEQVVSNKDLDLPTQQELLAQFRCDEIATAAFAAFVAEVKSFRKPLEAGQVLAQLGDDMARHRREAMVRFDREASRYHADVYARKRHELLDKLNATLSPLFLAQLKNLHRASLASFKSGVLQGLRGDGYDFGEVVGEQRRLAEASFEAGATAVRLDETDWSTDEESAQLRDELDAIAEQLRADETRKMVVAIERSVRKSVAEPVELALARPDRRMWDRVLAAFKEALERAEATYMKKAKSFNCTDDENEAALSALRRKSWLSLRSKVEEQLADAVLAAKLRDAFEERFRYDDAGVPRVWRPEDDMDGAFRKARDETLSLVPLYARIEPTDASLEVRLPSTSEDALHAAQVARGEDDEFDFDATLSVLSESRKAEVGARLRREADALYVEAKRATVAGVAQVPVWIYGLMALLGWNEAVAVIRSPLYFTALVLLAASAYVVWRLNLEGPLVSVSKAVGREVHRLVDDQLRSVYGKAQQQYHQPPPPQQPVAAQPVAAAATAGGGAAAPRPRTTAEEIELRDRATSKVANDSG